ncbi:MAG: transposase family protein, partial [Methanosarcinales archaeon]|nr:transposase family protein [Methanosarcinales archaeon]
KIQNKAINSARIVVEHAIGRIKRFQIARLE